MERRQFIGTAIAAGAGSLVSARSVTGQVSARPASARIPEVELLYKAPDTYPNALEAADDGLWIADQVSERVFRVDWETGAVLHEVLSESHNTSGLGVGGGYLWMGANGAGTAAQLREARPTDRPYSQLLQLDMNTGRTIRAHRPPWTGGIHGVTYVSETNRVWVVALGFGLVEMDPRDNYRILHMVPARAEVPHGIDWYDGSVWCMYAADRLAQRIDPVSGQVLETYVLTADHPDPHGMCIHEGYMYFSDAGLGGGREPSPGTAPEYICRFRLS